MHPDKDRSLGASSLPSLLSANVNRLTALLCAGRGSHLLQAFSVSTLQKYGSVVNISRLLFSNVQEKTVGENHILQLQLSQIFSSLIQCTDIFCASHLDFEVNYKISCYDRTKRIFLVPQLVNQIRGT